MQWSEFSAVLKPSTLGGIGVFATHDIPSGTQIFTGKHEKRTFKVKDLPEELLKYCTYTNEEDCVGPERFDRMEIGWYLNHSFEPNSAISVVKNSDATAPVERAFFAIKLIKAGDEILMDYNSLNEPEHLKEDYYTPPSSE